MIWQAGYHWTWHTFCQTFFKKTTINCRRTTMTTISTTTERRRPNRQLRSKSRRPRSKCRRRHRRSITRCQCCKTVLVETCRDIQKWKSAQNVKNAVLKQKYTRILLIYSKIAYIWSFSLDFLQNILWLNYYQNEISKTKDGFYELTWSPVKPIEISEFESLRNKRRKKTTESPTRTLETLLVETTNGDISKTEPTPLRQADSITYTPLAFLGVKENC